MKVSIITVTYNSEKTLQRTIDSVISQDYQNIEYILVDGNSSDRTLNVIQSNPSISRYISEPDRGIYEAINKGIRMATGDIIGILNSDDVFADRKVISKVVEIMVSKQSDIIYGNLMYFGNNNLDKAIRIWESSTFNPSYLKYGWMPPHPTIYCRKSVYDTYGLYNENFQISSDYDFILRVFKQHELKKSFLPIVMIKMCWGGKSTGSLTNIIKKSKEDYKVIKENQVGGIYTLFLKNARKVKQFFNHHL